MLRERKKLAAHWPTSVCLFAVVVKVVVVVVDPVVVAVVDPVVVVVW